MAKVQYDKSPEDEWNERNSSIKPSATNDVAFSQIFEEHLPKSEKFTCIEIGATPGNFLVYFHKKFGYKITGIDFADNVSLFHETMKKNNVKEYTFIKDDFFKHEFKEQFDVVASFGFIEHFDDTYDVLERHVKLVKPGGYLVITLPNFRFLQHIYHYYFDLPNLKIHNLRAMRVGYLKKAMKKLGMKKIYIKFFGNLQVWMQDTDLSVKKRRQVNSIHRWIETYGGKFPSTRLYSPYIVLIYRKPSGRQLHGEQHGGKVGP